jgi:glutamate-5-semialdehyde dehydrogenase
MPEEAHNHWDSEIMGMAVAARSASRIMALLPAERKNAVLLRLAKFCDERRLEIQQANALDLTAGEQAGLSGAMLDRLRLNDARIDQIMEGLHQVANLPDPVGEVMETLAPPSGLDIRKVRVPMGVIGIIYESRPNVTIDCAALCLKSGNAAILRGGKEAFHSNQMLAALIRDALVAEGLPEAAVALVPTTDRAAMLSLLKQDAYVHCIIPRGGHALIRFVVEHSTIPVIKHYTGVCAVYVDRSADLEKALAIVENAKCQRPGVCNAIENLVVHRDVLESHFLPIARRLVERGVELRVEPHVKGLLSGANLPGRDVTEQDYHEEFLDLILAVKVVDSIDEAIDFIHTYGSGHSDAIVTEDADTATAFLQGVDGATVYWNASTRFTDGFEFGFGAEIGISTDRLHARGPMGLRELCSYKFLIYGKGEIRK